MPSPKPTTYFSMDEIAEALGVHVKTVRRRIADGSLRAHRIGRQIRISADDFRAFTALQREAVVSR